MIRSPCLGSDTCTCGCHGRTLRDLKHDWGSCCGHPLTRGLMWPDPPAGRDDWPRCWCGSGKLVTGFVGDRTTGAVTLYSSKCCVLWSMGRDQPEGPTALLDGWHEAVDRIGGIKALLAINRGEQPPESNRPEVRVSDRLAQPVLF